MPDATYVYVEGGGVLSDASNQAYRSYDLKSSNVNTWSSAVVDEFVTMLRSYTEKQL